METIIKEDELALEPTYTGSHFKMVHPEGCYHKDGKLFKYEYITFEGGRYVQVAELPFIPTFTRVKARVEGSWWICDQLTAEENEELELSNTHWSGSYYRTHVNDRAKQAWVGYFFYQTIKEKYGYC